MKLTAHPQLRLPLRTAALTLVLLACGACSPKIQFQQDDYDAARREALRRGVPLFVDVWASWCHSCMSMKQYVLTDPALQRLAPRFVWLSVDSERAQNRAFLERFKNANLPTLWVIDARTEQPLLKWIGAATVPELSALLDGAEPRPGAAPASGASGEAAALFLRGNRQSAQGDGAAAIESYRTALARAAPGFRQRPQLIEALSMRLFEAKRDAEALELAAREAPALPPATSRINVIINGIEAGMRLGAPPRAELGPLVELAIRSTRDPELQALVDDRSSLYETLVDALRERQPERAKRLAAAWAELLEAQARQAPTPAARRVWDAHRLDAYLALGEPGRALAMLEQSQAEQPDDYNPPARLARAYLALGRHEPARAAIERALARCSGPRKLRLFMLKADILIVAGDRAGARGALIEALDFARSAGLPDQTRALEQRIAQRVAELS